MLSVPELYEDENLSIERFFLDDMKLEAMIGSKPSFALSWAWSPFSVKSDSASLEKCF